MAAAAAEAEKLEKDYQKKDPRGHVLLRPQVYLGSMEMETNTTYIVDPDASDMATARMVLAEVTYVPGLCKTFDEVLVNASDRIQKKDETGCNEIRVVVDEKQNCVSVTNDGKSIPIKLHPQYKIYLPELLLGNMFSSTNFNDDEKRTVGGLNGVGGTLANIMSTKYKIEIDDVDSGKRYVQVFTKNMSKIGAPKITDCKTKNSKTKITFWPDLPRFAKMESLDAGIIAMMQRRTWDIAGTHTNAKIYWNGKRIPVRHFKDYSARFVPEDAPIVYEEVNERWQICISIANPKTKDKLKQISFVNHIYTALGGQHLKHVRAKVQKVLDETIAKLPKDSDIRALQPKQIKASLFFMVNCIIENPDFDSQAKVNLTTPPSKFGSSCDIQSVKFAQRLKKAGILEHIADVAAGHANKELAKTDGKKRSRVTGLGDKYQAANWAGTKRSKECTLILCEGDSAKALVVAGIASIPGGSDRFGVYALKGKVLNTGSKSGKKLAKNDVVTAIKQILGLKSGVVYKSSAELNYGFLDGFTDQDHDGAHIWGLSCNLFRTQWPSLFQLPGFLNRMVTPVAICTKKGMAPKEFYTLQQLEAWKEAEGIEGARTKGWSLKYYKGLGTSTNKDAAHYFATLKERTIPFKYESKEDDQAMGLAFDQEKGKADKRKEWLQASDPANSGIDYARVKTVRYTEFINKELVLYSHASNARGLPRMFDGLKPSTRKVLFAAFKRRLTESLKVVQFQGYVSEHTAYHHGEASLNQVIVKMAQNFPGSNNVNLLWPDGQFGSRGGNGDDHASPRYIFTRLSQVTRFLFREEDDSILQAQYEDGMQIEPVEFWPVIPFVLVNGQSGMGTGWNCDVPPYNPKDIVTNLRHVMAGEDQELMEPWYKNFIGTIAADEEKDVSAEFGPRRFTMFGTIAQESEDKWRITEIPLIAIGKYKTDVLEALMTVPETEKEGSGPIVSDYKEYHDNVHVNFLVVLTEHGVATLSAAAPTDILKMFKLTENISTAQMNMWDENSAIRRYESPYEIIQEFHRLRLPLYEKRLAFMVAKLEHELLRLSNKARFVLMVANEELKVGNVDPETLDATLEELKFDRLAETEDGTGGKQTYNYLTRLGIYRLTLPEVQKLQAEQEEKQAELEVLRARTAIELWESDLCELEEALQEHERLEQEDRAAPVTAAESGAAPKKRKKAASKPALTTAQASKPKKQKTS